MSLNDEFLGQYSIELTEGFARVEFELPHKILSSAVLHGGLAMADHILNLKVDQNFMGNKKDFEQPEKTLSDYCLSKGWNGKVVGMMTSALMASFRGVRMEAEGIEVTALITSGAANAKRAGEKAEYREIGAIPRKTGTINTIILTNAFLSDAAMTEAVAIATEAKSAALQNIEIKSPYSGLIATGTGTDSIAVACSVAKNSKEVKYCGKHTLFGEMLAQSVIHTLTSSLSQTRDKGMMNP